MAELLHDDMLIGICERETVSHPTVNDTLQEPEGLDPNLNFGWADYPLDSVFVRKEERSVGEVVKRIRAKRYQLDPEFQRNFVWGSEKQSKLIESCIMRIPLPVFYVAEAKDGSIIVVDGLQRLTTLFRFMENLLHLKGFTGNISSSRHPLEGKTYSDLPTNLKERIEDTQLIFYILDSKAPERARLDIFDRVNSGVPLSRQQMRNSLYSGPATRWLKDAAESTNFLKATGRSLDPNTMRDREAINRFCAFKLLKFTSYRGGDMDGFLGATLERMNSMPENELRSLRQDFEDSMVLNHQLFGAHAFRKSLRDSDAYARRSVINIALWDVTSEYFSNVSLDQKDETFEDLRDCIIELLDDPDFGVSITYSTNSTSAVKTRFEMMNEKLDQSFPS